VAIIVYALTGPAPGSRIEHPAATSTGVVNEVTQVPPAMFDAVGVTAPMSPLVAPALLEGQPLLVSDGKPEVFFVGSEFCPFCGAERWPLVVALARFGHFSALYNMQSSGDSVFPGIETFTFAKPTYSSRYLSFDAVELYSDQVGTDGSYTRIARLTAPEAALVVRYRTVDHADTGEAPFVDIGGRMVTATSGFSPAVLVHLSQSAIAGDLTQKANPVTQAVLASANYLTAGMCMATGQLPTSVCTSKGVVEASDALVAKTATG